MEIYLIKLPNNDFRCAYDSDYDEMLKIKSGEAIKCTITKARNYKLHKKAMALIKMVFDSQEFYTDINELRKDLTIEAGFYTENVNFFTGEVRKEAKSWRFETMDEYEFNQVYERIKDVICLRSTLVPESIIENIHQYY